MSTLVFREQQSGYSLVPAASNRLMSRHCHVRSDSRMSQVKNKRFIEALESAYQKVALHIECFDFIGKGSHDVVYRGCSYSCQIFSAIQQPMAKKFGFDQFTDCFSILFFANTDNGVPLSAPKVFSFGYELCEHF